MRVCVGYMRGSINPSLSAEAYSCVSFGHVEIYDLGVSDNCTQLKLHVGSWSNNQLSINA